MNVPATGSLQLLPFFRGKAKHDLIHFYENSDKTGWVQEEILFFHEEKVIKTILCMEYGL